jgi:hypothetical protein
LKFAKGKDLKVGKTLNRDEADEVRTAPHSTSDLLGLIGFPNPSLGGTMCMGQALRMNAHLTSSHHSTGEIQTCCHTMSYGPIQSRNQGSVCHMAPNFTQQEGNNCPKCRWSSCVAKAKVLTILDISLSATGNAGVGLSGMDETL